MNGRGESGDVSGAGARPRGVWLATALLGLTTFSAPASAQATRAERSDYAQTSSHADVIAFLDSLVKLAPGRMVRGTTGWTTAGRETPYLVASLAMFRAWDPDVFVDLHTTNGSYHGYALTYAPSLHPAAMLGGFAPAGPWTRDTLLPELRRRVRERRGFETIPYSR